MTSEKRDTAKKRAIDGVERLRFRDVTVTTEDGREHNIRVRLTGDEAGDDVKTQALDYIQRRREAEAYAKEPTPEKIEERAEELARIASNTITTTLLVKVQERDGEGALEEGIGERLDVDFDEFRERLKKRFRRIVLELLENPEVKAKLFSELETEAVAAILGELAKHDEPEGLTDQERAEHWSHLYDEVGEKKLASTLALYSIGIAKEVLDRLKADEMTADRLIAWYQTDPEGDQAAEILTADTRHFYNPADRTFERLVQYVGKRLEPEGYRDVDGSRYMKLPDIRRASVETSLHVRYSPHVEVLGSENVEPVLARIQAERNETKAKTLVAAFGLASDQRAGFDPASFEVDLHEFVTLVSGYRRSGPKKTQSRRYWQAAAEILRYLTFDLAIVQVNIKVVRRKGKTKTEEQYLGEYLMHRPRLMGQQPFAYESLHEHLRTLIVQSEDNEERQKEAVAYLQQLKPTSVVLGFPPNVMKSFGSHEKAVELTNPDVLSLKGPTFWLAYEITFRRRWAKKRIKDGEGMPLLDELEKYGFLEAAKKGERISYSKALKAFFASVAQLVDLGELDTPGALIWQPQGENGRPRNITKELRTRAEKRSSYITESDLRSLKVAYQHQADRRKALEEARSKAEAKEKRARSKRRKSPDAG